MPLAIELGPPRVLRAALIVLAILALAAAAGSEWPALMAAVPFLLLLAWPRTGGAVATFGTDGTVQRDGRPVRSFAFHPQGPLAVLTLDRRHHVVRNTRALSLWFARRRDV